MFNALSIIFFGSHENVKFNRYIRFNYLFQKYHLKCNVELRFIAVNAVEHFHEDVYRDFPSACISRFSEVTVINTIIFINHCNEISATDPLLSLFSQRSCFDFSRHFPSAKFPFVTFTSGSRYSTASLCEGSKIICTRIESLIELLLI